MLATMMEVREARGETEGGLRRVLEGSEVSLQGPYQGGRAEVVLIAVQVSGDVIVDLLHAVCPEKPEVLAEGLFMLLVALGKGGAEPGVGDTEGGFQRTESQEGEPQVAAPAGGPDSVQAEAGGHLVEEGLEDVEEVSNGVERATSPDVRQGHCSATAADLAEREGAIPRLAKGEGASGFLPQELPEAGGDVGAPNVNEVG